MLSLELGWQSVRLVEPRLARVVVNTALPFGAAVALVNDDWVRAVRETKRPAVSAVQLDPATKQHFVSIGVPVMRGGRLRYVARRPHPRERSSAPSCAGNSRRPTASSR